MKIILTILLPASLTLAAGAAVFTNSPDADSFVRAAAPTLNYGAAGSLAVSGAGATNASGTANGVFDSFIRFNTGAMVTGFNSEFGAGNWAVSSATLQVTEVGAPGQTIFNRGKGSFEILWITNDNWTEGLGTPMATTTTGITFNDEASLTNSATDESLGAFTNSGANSTLNFHFALPAGFVNDLQAGGEVTLFLTANDPGIGFTFNSQNFTTASARPFLMVSAAPEPGITAINWSGTNLVLSATNGAADGTYYVLTSTDPTVPLNQWMPVLTNVLASSGDFDLTVTNPPTTSTAQFFILRTQ